MKAVVYEKYGSPIVLELQEVSKPTPKDNEVLIKVQAVSLNASDWEFLRGKPLYARLRGLLKPRIKILGSDVAGQVEAVGRNVKRFQPGDEVFGDILERSGGFAEYVCACEKAITLKPDSMTFEEAAALPQAACIALQGLFPSRNLRGDAPDALSGGFTRSADPGNLLGADPFIGEIMLVAFTFCPRDWTECDGQLLSINSNQALFSLLGTTYGGDGRTNFALPDLRGRSAVHLGTGPGGSNVRLGDRCGTPGCN